MNLDFGSSIKIKAVCATTLLSGATTCGITVCGVTVKGTTLSGTTICGGIVCASTCFTGSGAGLTGTASSLTAGTATNATCLGGQLSTCYARKDVTNTFAANNCFQGITGTTLNICCATTADRNIYVGNCCNYLTVGVDSTSTYIQARTATDTATPINFYVGSIQPLTILSNGTICTCICFAGSGAGLTGVNASSLCGCTPNCFTSKSVGLSGATNGLTTTSNVVKLGGRLTQCTHIEGNYCFDVDAVQGFNVRTSGNTDINIDAQNCGGFILKSQCGSVDTFPDFTNAIGFYGNIDQPSGFAIYDNRTGTSRTGIVYNGDYSTNYTSRSLVDKGYVDSVATGLNVHASVLIATTGPITLSGNSQTIDGVSVTTVISTNNRILVKNQSSGATNGIYSASTGTWGRTSDYKTNIQITNGDLIPVTSGSSQNNSIWVLTTPDPIIVGTTALSFTEFSTVIDISAGNGISVIQTGGVHQINVQLASNCGLTFCGTGLAVNPNIAGSCLTYTNGVLAVCSGCFLAVGGTANNANCLGGTLAACYARRDVANNFASTNCFQAMTGTTICGSTKICSPIVCATSCVRSALISGTTICGGTINGTATCASTAGNALALCGCTPACFLGATATASNSLGLCGCTPACFLGATATATCASTAGNALALCSCIPSCFLGATATACSAALSCCMCTFDTRNTVTTPQTLTSPGIIYDFKANATESLADDGTYFGEMTFRKYGSGTDWTGGGSHQLGFTNNSSLWHRYGTNTTWGTWYKMWSSADFALCAASVGSTVVCRDGNGDFCARYGCATDWIASSDCRLKTCICPITNALSTVMCLQGVSYRLCDDENNENHLGLIAQDVQKFLPEVVSHDTPTEIDYKYGICDDKLGLKYDKLAAVLIEAIKEQQKQIKEQEKQLHCLCIELNYMRNSNT